ncbi:unnamed protein product [Staurois parvus]|uniref:Secreted protein n=1 Tax=Staurois parvus TaxID=386267 RepID=A0ABN9CIE5_9NEOB|nr:unnamed protein product [Staurois parvus]
MGDVFHFFLLGLTTQFVVPQQGVSLKSRTNTPFRAWRSGRGPKLKPKSILTHILAHNSSYAPVTLHPRVDYYADTSED